MSDQYVPGVCNIGDTEVKFRRVTQGWGGLAVSIALFTIINFFQFSYYIYFVLFLPILVSALGFLQAKEKFCAFYGKMGVNNMSGQVGETKEIIGPLKKEKDYIKSKSIFIKAASISAAATTILCIVGPKI